MKYYNHLTLIFFITSIFFCHTTYADNIIKIAASDFPPYTIVSGESITGIDIILANKLTQKLGLSIEYVKCPWKRCLKLMEHGKIDMLTGVYKRPEREAYMLFLTPYYIEATNSFYISSKNSIEIKQYNDLKKLKIGLERGTRAFEPFDSDSSLDKYEVNKLSQAIKMTRLSRLDTFIGATIPTNYLLLKTNNQNNFKRASFTIKSKKTYAYFTLSKKSKYHKKQHEFNKTLKALKTSGEIKNTFRLFSLGGDIPKYPIDKPLIQAKKL